MLNQSQQNFAHIKTVLLSWRVQNFVVICGLYYEQQHYKFCLILNSIKISLVWWAPDPTNPTCPLGTFINCTQQRGFSLRIWQLSSGTGFKLLRYNRISFLPNCRHENSWASCSVAIISRQYWNCNNRQLVLMSLWQINVTSVHKQASYVYLLHIYIHTDWHHQ